MAADIKVPTLGESVTTATIARWIKKAGDSVAADEPVVELETDKVTVEVNAPEAGTISEILAEEGAEVEIGALLGRIGAAGAAGAAATPVPAPKQAAAASAIATPGVVPPKPAPGPVARPGALPAAAKMMAEKKISEAEIGTGTAKDGRVSKGDVLAFINKPPAPQAPAAAKPARAADAREERVKMTRLRKTIAARLKEAQNNAAMLTTFNEVDMSAIMALRADYKEAFEKKHKGVRLGFNGFFVKAVIAALAEFPAVNAEIDGDEIVYKNFVHMGIAVGGANGLVVPVICDADQKSIAEIEATISGFAKRAKDGTLKLEDLSGGTFSITNGGVYGSLMSTPILNPPQSAILGMHKIQDRPVAIGGKVEIRPMMYLAVSYDHRIIDGREAVSFLVRVKESLEDPRRMLLEI
ncbi:MAG: 2-oxoglutarate dehydrogenase complex dihydrolipoyllysine-residue succinyltransferase [Acidocella sp.]|nr:2-oxoglutarate dehydrogenase complex dihydrolipoyllysine-residue succinyltransferase [Acidocella sp.]